MHIPSYTKSTYIINSKNEHWSILSNHRNYPIIFCHLKTYNNCPYHDCEKDSTQVLVTSCLNHNFFSFIEIKQSHVIIYGFIYSLWNPTCLVIVNYFTSLGHKPHHSKYGSLHQTSWSSPIPTFVMLQVSFSSNQKTHIHFS